MDEQVGKLVEVVGGRCAECEVDFKLDVNYNRLETGIIVIMRDGKLVAWCHDCWLVNGGWK